MPDRSECACCDNGEPVPGDPWPADELRAFLSRESPSDGGGVPERPGIGTAEAIDVLIPMLTGFSGHFWVRKDGFCYQKSEVPARRGADLRYDPAQVSVTQIIMSSLLDDPSILANNIFDQKADRGSTRSDSDVTLAEGGREDSASDFEREASTNPSAADSASLPSLKNDESVSERDPCIGRRPGSPASSPQPASASHAASSVSGSDDLSSSHRTLRKFAGLKIDKDVDDRAAKPEPAESPMSESPVSIVKMLAARFQSGNVPSLRTNTGPGRVEEAAELAGGVVKERIRTFLLEDAGDQSPEPASSSLPSETDELSDFDQSGRLYSYNVTILHRGSDVALNSA